MMKMTDGPYSHIHVSEVHLTNTTDRHSENNLTKAYSLWIYPDSNQYDSSQFARQSLRAGGAGGWVEGGGGGGGGAYC